MNNNKAAMILPVLIITLGTGWLLMTLGIAPKIDWIWTLGLAVIGLLTFALSGFDKVSVVVGPFFLIASCFSLARQLGSLPVDIEVPLLVIAIGVLLFIARLRFVPMPKWAMIDGGKS